MGEVIKMEKNRLENQYEKKDHEVLHNSVKEKGDTVNQNQSHNSRREGMGPNTKRRSD